MNPREAEALDYFKQTAERMGHKFNFLFRNGLSEIPKYNAVFIRATTDPLLHRLRCFENGMGARIKGY